MPLTKPDCLAQHNSIGKTEADHLDAECRPKTRDHALKHKEVGEKRWSRDSYLAVLRQYNKL